jgi:hypothetical protein
MREPEDPHSKRPTQAATAPKAEIADETNPATDDGLTLAAIRPLL